MKLVNESISIIKESKSEDIFNENKKDFQQMIKSTMKKFKLSKNVAASMLAKGIEDAANFMD